MRTAKLFHGDCREVLKTLPERSIHCCVTSPPYLGLRDYKLPPTNWGGSAECPHEWGGGSVRRAGVSGGTQASGLRYGGAGSSPDGVARTVAAASVPSTTSAFCSLCGAWRGSLGLEPDVNLYVAHVVEVFREAWRVLRDDGCAFVNLGDSYASAGCAGPQGASGQRFGRRHTQEPLLRARAGGCGPKPKSLYGVPWRVALALEEDGWYLRSEIIWNKPAPMPESVRDRPTRSHEHIFLLAKQPRYFYDADAVRETDKGADHARAVLAGQPSLEPSGGLAPKRSGLRTASGRDGAGRNLRTVWEIGPEPCPEAHFATFPSAIPRTCILAGTSAAGCCPACGAPYARVVTRKFRPQADVSPERSVRGNGQTKGLDSSNRWQGSQRGTTTTETSGWRPTCKCVGAGDPVPCTVLDPLMGTGRTGLAALELGRSFVGIDLSQIYLETIARPAIAAALMQDVIGEERDGLGLEVDGEQRGLFE